MATQDTQDFSSALGGAGLGVSAINTIGSGITNYISSGAQARYQKAIAESNAAIAAYKIKDATDRGDLAASAYLQKVDQLRGSQKASLAGQGIDIGEGSAYQALSDTTTGGAIDAITIRNNAAREAFGFKLEDISNSASAKLSQIGAQQRGEQSLLTAGSGFLGDSLQAASKFSSIFAAKKKGA